MICRECNQKIDEEVVSHTARCDKCGAPLRLCRIYRTLERERPKRVPKKERLKARREAK